MDTSDIITVSVIGVYTLVYVIIFFIQKSQIDRHKSVIESMERFMNIFKLEEVERFVKMRHEGTLEQVKKHLRDNQVKMKDEVIMPEILKGVKGIDQRMTDKFDEMAEVVYSMILAAPKQERKDFIEKFLPLNSDMFVEALEEDGETSSSQKGNPDD